MIRKQIFMQEVKRNPLHTILAILLMPAAYYGILMVSLILSFNNFPNSSAKKVPLNAMA